MRKPTRLSLIVLFCLTTLSVQAQEKKPSPTPKPAIEVDDVIRISTELVQTDVTVFDKQGKFVDGLKQEQFELLIDGKPQPIDFFESIVAGARSERAALRAARDNKRPQPVSEPDAISDRERTILFFINDLHLDTGSLARTHKTVSYYIDNMLGPNDQVAITSSSGQIGFLQQLTNNPVVLHAALDRLKFVAGTVRDGERPYMSDYAAYLIAEQRDRQLFDYYVRQTMGAQNLPQPLAESVVEQRSRSIVRQSDITIKTALSSLVNLMNSVGKLSGRKLVFFISDGFVPNFSGSDFTSVMGRATDAANRGGAVIYSLDARGLMTDSFLDASQGGGADTTGVLMNRMGAERNFTQEPLHALAADTGGRALLNSNDLQGGIARGLDETSRYYLVAWRPVNEAQRASNFSKIKITIAGRPDLKVQLRRGYLGSPAVSKAKAEITASQIEKADDLGMTESSTEELRTALSVGYKQASGGNMQLSTSVQVNAHSADDSSGRLDVNVLGAVFDSKGKAVGSFKQRVEVQRTPANVAAAYATVNHQVDVPPGLYQVRVFSYERGTTKLSSAMDWIEVPKLKPGAFSISSLYVGEIGAANGASQVTVNAHRRFARNSRMRFTTYIYNASYGAAPPQLGVQLKILRGQEAIITPPEAKVSTEKQANFANITYTGEFPLSSLTPGSYVMEVSVTDKIKTTSSSQRLKFTVY